MGDCWIKDPISNVFSLLSRGCPEESGYAANTEIGLVIQRRIRM